jgi:urea transport system permease protein
MLESFVEFKTQASLAKVIAFVAVVALLQIRPQGLVSVRSRALT